MADFPAFDAWVPPWKDDVDFDAERAKKLIYDRSKDKHDAAALNSRLAAERDEAVTKLQELERAGETKAEKVERENADLRKKVEQGESSGLQAENFRLTVALEKGLNARQAKRLVGASLEELREDADEMLKDFGKSDSKNGKEPEDDDDDHEDDDEGEPVRMQPRIRSSRGGKPETTIDHDKFADDFLAGR